MQAMLRFVLKCFKHVLRDTGFVERPITTDVLGQGLAQIWL